jgi:uncharacterized repeat protein (TIGR01451 family)
MIHMRRIMALVVATAALAIALAGSAAASAGDSADLGVTVTADKTSYKVGDLVTYTVTVTNYGDSAAEDVTLTDLLPSSLALVSTTVDSSPSDTASSSSTSIGSGTLALDTIDPTSDTSLAARIADGALLDLGYDVGTGTGKTLDTVSLGWLGSETYWSTGDSTDTVTIVARATASGTTTNVVSVDSSTPDPNEAANNYALSSVAVAA